MNQAWSTYHEDFLGAIFVLSIVIIILRSFKINSLSQIWSYIIKALIYGTIGLFFIIYQQNHGGINNIKIIDSFTVIMCCVECVDNIMNAIVAFKGQKKQLESEIKTYTSVNFRAFNTTSIKVLDELKKVRKILTADNVSKANKQELISSIGQIKALVIELSDSSDIYLLVKNSIHWGVIQKDTKEIQKLEFFNFSKILLCPTIKKINTHLETERTTTRKLKFNKDDVVKLDEVINEYSNYFLVVSEIHASLQSYKRFMQQIET